MAHPYCGRFSTLVENHCAKVMKSNDNIIARMEGQWKREKYMSYKRLHSNPIPCCNARCKTADAVSTASCAQVRMKLVGKR